MATDMRGNVLRRWDATGTLPERHLPSSAASGTGAPGTPAAWTPGSTNRPRIASLRYCLAQYGLPKKPNRPNTLEEQEVAEQGEDSAGQQQEEQEDSHAHHVGQTLAVASFVGNADGHQTGDCKPCVFLFYGCCLHGADCQYCHLPHDNADYKKYKLSRLSRKNLRKARRQSAVWSSQSAGFVISL